LRLADEALDASAVSQTHRFRQRSGGQAIIREKILAQMRAGMRQGRLKL
jgi:hypothetical protein